MSGNNVSETDSVHDELLEDVSNHSQPFRLPDEKDLLEYRQKRSRQLRQQYKEKLSVPIERRNYFQPRVTRELEPHSDSEEEGAQISANLKEKLFFTNQKPLKSARKSQTKLECIQHGREMFFEQHAIDVKQEKIRELERLVEVEEECIRRKNANLDKQKLELEKSLEIKMKKTQGVIRQAEEARGKNEKTLQKISEMVEQINATEAIIEEEFGKYERLRQYQKFLYEIAPKEWRAQYPEEMNFSAFTESCPINESHVIHEEIDIFEEPFFSDPKQILTVLIELEDANIKLIKQYQETEDDLDEMKEISLRTKEQLTQKLPVLLQESEILTVTMTEEESKAKKLKLMCLMFNLGEFKKDEEEDALKSFNQMVTSVYLVASGNTDAFISTEAMLASIEGHLERMFRYLDQVPAEKLNTARIMRLRMKKLKMREITLQQYKAEQEEKARRSFKRVMAPAFKSGRTRLPRSRSRPRTPKRYSDKVGQVENDEENTYFFGDEMCDD